jgi:hypothetical protein
MGLIYRHETTIFSRQVKSVENDSSLFAAKFCKIFIGNNFTNSDV